MESTIQADLGEKAFDHNPLNVLSPVISQALPMRTKVCAEQNANVTQVRIEGTQPVPDAFPAANVKIPAPATLLAKLKTEVRMEALPVDSVTAFRFWLPTLPTSIMTEAVSMRLFGLVNFL